jgi:ankyrin repeat protein
LLLSYAPDLQARNNKALCVACNNGDLSVVQFLLDQGVDCTYPDNKPIRKAFRHPEKFKIQKLLLEHGADPNARYSSSHTILEQSIINIDFDSSKLLLEYGADLDLCCHLLNGKVFNYEYFKDRCIFSGSTWTIERSNKFIAMFMEYNVDLRPMKKKFELFLSSQLST